MDEGGGDGSIDSGPTPEPRPPESAPTGDTEGQVDQSKTSIEGDQKPKLKRERMNYQTIGVVEDFRKRLMPDGSNAGELLSGIAQGELVGLIEDPKQLALARRQLSKEFSAAAGIRQERKQRPYQTVSETSATAAGEPEATTDQGQVQTPELEAQPPTGSDQPVATEASIPEQIPLKDTATPEPAQAATTEPEQPLTGQSIVTPEPVPENQPPQGSAGNTEKFDKVYLDVYRNWVERGTRGEDLSGLESTLKIDDPEQKRILIEKIRSQVSRRFAAAAEPNSSEGQLAQAVAGVVENGGKSPAAAEPQTPFKTGAKFTPEPITPIGKRFVPESRAETPTAAALPASVEVPPTPAIQVERSTENVTQPPIEAVPTPPGPAVPTEAQPAPPVPEPEPTPTEADLASKLATGGAGGGDKEPPTATGATPPESSDEGDNVLRETMSEVQSSKIDLADYEGVTKEDIDDELSEYSEAVRTLRKRNALLDPNSEQYQKNERAIASGRAKIKELKYVKDKKFGSEQTVVSGQTEADWQRVERARIESISDYETMPVDELRSTVDTLRRQRNALSRRLGEEIITGNPVRKAAVNAELADAQSRLIEAEKIAKERGPIADQEKYEADRKALENKAKALLGEKRTIEQIRQDIATGETGLSNLSGEAHRLEQELLDPNLSAADKAARQKQLIEVLNKLNEAALLQAGNQEALENHPEAVVGQDRVYKFNTQEYDNASPAKKAEILTAYGATLDYTLAEVAAIDAKLENNERVEPKELAIYAKEIGDILGKKKDGNVDMKDLMRYCRAYPELQASVFTQVAQSEAVTKAFQEKYPTSWRKMLNFAKNHKGLMWILLALLATGTLGVAGVGMQTIAGTAGNMGRGFVTS